MRDEALPSHLAPIACILLQHQHKATPAQQSNPTPKPQSRHNPALQRKPNPPAELGIHTQITPQPSSPTTTEQNPKNGQPPPKIPLSSASSTSTNPQHARDLQDQITLALLSNGGIARIQTALRQRLDEAGWSENLREYVTALFRSGECATYFEAMEKVRARVRLEGRDEEGEGVDGAGGADLVVPVGAAEGGVEAVRRELEGVCEMRRKEG